MNPLALFYTERERETLTHVGGAKQRKIVPPEPVEKCTMVTPHTRNQSKARQPIVAQESDQRDQAGVSAAKEEKTSGIIQSP